MVIMNTYFKLISLKYSTNQVKNHEGKKKMKKKNHWFVPLLP